MAVKRRRNRHKSVNFNQQEQHHQQQHLDENKNTKPLKSCSNSSNINNNNNNNSSNKNISNINNNITVNKNNKISTQNNNSISNCTSCSTNPKLQQELQLSKAVCSQSQQQEQSQQKRSTLPDSSARLQPHHYQQQQSQQQMLTPAKFKATVSATNVQTAGGSGGSVAGGKDTPAISQSSTVPTGNIVNVPGTGMCNNESGANSTQSQHQHQRAEYASKQKNYNNRRKFWRNNWNNNGGGGSAVGSGGGSGLGGMAGGVVSMNPNGSSSGSSSGLNNQHYSNSPKRQYMQQQQQQQQQQQLQQKQQHTKGQLQCQMQPINQAQHIQQQQHRSNDYFNRRGSSNDSNKQQQHHHNQHQQPQIEKHTYFDKNKQALMHNSEANNDQKAAAGSKSTNTNANTIASSTTTLITTKPPPLVTTANKSQTYSEAATTTTSQKQIFGAAGASTTSLSSVSTTNNTSNIPTTSTCPTNSLRASSGSDCVKPEQDHQRSVVASASTTTITSSDQDYCPATSSAGQQDQQQQQQQKKPRSTPAQKKKKDCMPRPYSLDFLHRVGSYMTGDVSLMQQHEPNPTSIRPVNYTESPYPPGSPPLRYNYANMFAATRPPRYNSYPHGSPFYHPHHHQPTQLTIASFLQKDLLGDSYVSSPPVGGNNGNSGSVSGHGSSSNAGSGVNGGSSVSNANSNAGASTGNSNNSNSSNYEGGGNSMPHYLQANRFHNYATHYHRNYGLPHTYNASARYGGGNDGSVSGGNVQNRSHGYQSSYGNVSNTSRYQHQPQQHNQSANNQVGVVPSSPTASQQLKTTQQQPMAQPQQQSHSIHVDMHKPGQQKQTATSRHKKNSLSSASSNSSLSSVASDATTAKESNCTSNSCSPSPPAASVIQQNMCTQNPSTITVTGVMAYNTYAQQQHTHQQQQHTHQQQQHQQHTHQQQHLHKQIAQYNSSQLPPHLPQSPVINIPPPNSMNVMCCSQVDEAITNAAASSDSSNRATPVVVPGYIDVDTAFNMQIKSMPPNSIQMHHHLHSPIDFGTYAPAAQHVQAAGQHQVQNNSTQHTYQNGMVPLVSVTSQMQNGAAGGLTTEDDLSQQQQLFFANGEQLSVGDVAPCGYWGAPPNIMLPNVGPGPSLSPHQSDDQQSQSSTAECSTCGSDSNPVQPPHIKRSNTNSSLNYRSSQISLNGNNPTVPYRRSGGTNNTRCHTTGTYIFPVRSLSNSSLNEYSHTPPDRFLARAHLVEAKEPPTELTNNSKWDNLSVDIWKKFVSSQQTEETFKMKMRLWRYMYITIKNAYPRYGLYLVGSTISGFGSDTSDVDMCLVARSQNSLDPRIEALVNLTALRDCLEKSGDFESFNLIEAKVPILRFRDRSNKFEVDLNYNNCVGIKNTHLLYCYSQLDWRLRPLVLVAKLWAQFHNINNAKNMTISSYSLVLMVIHFLQYGVNPPVLPCLHDMYPDKFPLLRPNDFGYVDMNETLGPFESLNTQTLGELFLEFLQYYSCFNYNQFAISIRVGGVLPIHICRNAKSLKNDIHQWRELCIEEPFDLTNTARSVYDFETFERVKAVFVASWRILLKSLDLSSIFEAITVQPLYAMPDAPQQSTQSAITQEESTSVAPESPNTCENKNKEQKTQTFQIDVATATENMLKINTQKDMTMFSVLHTSTANTIKKNPTINNTNGSNLNRKKSKNSVGSVSTSTGSDAVPSDDERNNLNMILSSSNSSRTTIGIQHGNNTAGTQSTTDNLNKTLLPLVNKSKTFIS